MFPSSGYFRGLDCPFYASGLCERPYCHYRHAKQSSEKDTSWIGKSATTNQKLNNHLGDTLLLDTDKGLLIEKAAHLNEVDKSFSKPTYPCTLNKDLTKLYTYTPQQVGISGGTYDKVNDSLDSSKYKTYTKYNCDGKSNYQPSCDNQIKKGRYEEYTISKKKEKKVSEYNCDIASNSVPEYNPTPISELKRMHRYSTQSMTHSDLEYDPVSNFDAGFSNKSFFNLLDNSYPSSQSVGKLTSGHSVYKPTRIPSDDDEERELVIDAKFSDDSDDEAVTSRLSEQGSDNETKEDPPVVNVSKNKADSSYSIHSLNISSSVSHKSSGDDSKGVTATSIKHVKTNSKSSSNEKINKASKSTNDKKHSSETTDSNKWKTILDEKNKLEKNKSSDDKIARKKKISESDKSSSSEKKLSSEKKSSSEKKASTSEKKVSSSHDKKSSSEKKVSSSDKNSGCASSSSSSSRDQSSIKKDKKESCNKEKSAEKNKKIKESRNLQNGKELNGSNEKHQSVKEKEHRKSENDRSGGASKERLKDENRKSEISSSLSVKKSSGEHGEKKRSDSQTKTDSNKVKLDVERKKEVERRKSEDVRKSDSESKKLEAVRRKSESEIKKHDLEKKKDGMSCKNSLYLKRKESEKKGTKDNSLIEKVRQETLLTKNEKLQRLKELNERVGVWKANHTEHKTNSERDKIPEKLRKTESSKVGDFTKKKLKPSSSTSQKSSSSNNVLDKSKKREYPSGENSHEPPVKRLKKENSEKYGCSSSDENPSSKKHMSSSLAVPKSSKHKISNSQSKQRHSSIIKDKKNRSISIDDLFGEESSEEEGSSSALGHSGGDESTGLSDDDELNVIFGDTDLSENDPYEECLRIFNESNSQIQQQQQQQLQQEHAKAAELAKKKEVPVELPPLDEGKKRVAHPGAASRVANDRLRKFARPALARPTPAQVMQNRFLEKQKRLAAEAKLQKEKSVTNLPSSQSKLSLLKHKMSLPKVGIPESCTANSDRTIAGTAAKNEKRTAHMPKKEIIIRKPALAADFNSKITSNIRQRYLNLIVSEYERLVPSQSAASDYAVNDEFQVYQNCNSKLGYLNKAIHLIKRLRSSNIDIMRLRLSSNRTPISRKLEHLVTGSMLYEKLRVYLLSEEELLENHFPRPDGVGRARFFLNDIAKDPYLPSDERFCVRCTKSFRVNSSGKPVVEEECMYHYGKLYNRKYGNSTISSYRCCEEPVGTIGCEVARCHVHHKNKFDGSAGYMITPDRHSTEGPGVFAIDCEMVYTTAGMELARITVINSECDVVYDTLVKPDHEILDYNTRFSGITENHMKNVITSLIHVQAVLLHYFSSDTILIGHSLESDLKAIKLIHSTVIDTSVLFPHRNGKPLKRSLKQLTQSYLSTTIQDGDKGHDSKEDAIATMRLVHYQLREDTNARQ